MHELIDAAWALARAMAKAINMSRACAHYSMRARARTSASLARPARAARNLA